MVSTKPCDSWVGIKPKTWNCQSQPQTLNQGKNLHQIHSQTAITPPIYQSSKKTRLRYGQWWDASSDLGDNGDATTSPNDIHIIWMMYHLIIYGPVQVFKTDLLEWHGLWPFYRFYTNWENMTSDQSSKAVAWFLKLPEHLQGNPMPYFPFCIM